MRGRALGWGRELGEEVQNSGVLVFTNNLTPQVALLIQISGVLAGSGSYQPAIKVLDQIRTIKPNISYVTKFKIITVSNSRHKNKCQKT